MSLELVKQAIDKTAEPEKRLESWKSFLQQMFVAETLLLNRVYNDNPSQFVTMALSYEYTQSDVPLPLEKINDLKSLIKNVENEIASLKSKATESQKERKIYTSKLDSVIDRMMLPEKTYKTYVDELTRVLMPLKRAEAEEERKIARRMQDLKDTRFYYQTQFNSNHAEHIRYINKQISVFYVHAVDNVKIEDKAAYIESCIKMIDATKFPKPNNIVNDKEKQEIIDEIYSAWNPDEFVNLFRQEFYNAFSSFETDKQNKAEAARKRLELEMAAEEENTTELKIKNEIASLDQRAETVVAPSIITKTLKTVYSLDMEHTEENMVKIIRAFFANIVACMANYRGDDIFNLSINKMGELLCLLKNKDERFAAEDIVFKANEKI